MSYVKKFSNYSNVKNLQIFQTSKNTNFLIILSQSTQNQVTTPAFTTIFILILFINAVSALRQTNNYILIQCLRYFFLQWTKYLIFHCHHQSFTQSITYTRHFGPLLATTDCRTIFHTSDMSKARSNVLHINEQKKIVLNLLFIKQIKKSTW